MKGIRPIALMMMSTLLLAGFAVGCGRKYEPLDLDSSAAPVVEGRELLAFVETEEEAREIAELYGIEFLDYSHGVAAYHTEEDPQSVVDRGEKNGYPSISLNVEIPPDDPE